MAFDPFVNVSRSRHERASEHRRGGSGRAGVKNAAIDLAGGDWVLVVDADERVSTPLATEIRNVLQGDHSAYRIPIENWFYGGRVRHGGGREQPIRLVKAGVTRYIGDIHEVLDLPTEASVGVLRNGLTHFSHRSIGDNLAKTRHYAELQAREMLAAGHPPVTWRTLMRIVSGQVGRRLLYGRAFRDGVPGLIEAVYQPFSMFCVYAHLWELQQSGSVLERYEQIDRSLP